MGGPTGGPPGAGDWGDHHDMVGPPPFDGGVPPFPPGGHQFGGPPRVGFAGGPGFGVVSGMLSLPALLCSVLLHHVLKASSR